MVVSQFVSVCELTHRAASPLPQLNLCNGPQTPNWWGEIWGDDKRIETLKKETCTSSTTVRAITFMNTQSGRLW